MSQEQKKGIYTNSEWEIRGRPLSRTCLNDSPAELSLANYCSPLWGYLVFNAIKIYFLILQSSYNCNAKAGSSEYSINVNSKLPSEVWKSANVYQK